jgi:hypothetical protein
LTKKIVQQNIIALLFLSFAMLFMFQWSGAQAQNLEINLIHKDYLWKPFSAAIVSQNGTDLNMIVVTDSNNKSWNRAYLPIKINSTTNNSVIFDLNYSTISNSGNATFFSEVRDNSSNKVLWSHFLNNNTNGQFTNGSFTLPSDIKNKPLEFRLYIATNGSGEHALDVKKAVLTVP